MLQLHLQYNADKALDLECGELWLPVGEEDSRPVNTTRGNNHVV